MSQPRKSFLLRIDPALWANLESWAAQDLRSVNAQIEYLLRQAVLKRKGGPANPPHGEDSASQHPSGLDANESG